MTNLLILPTGIPQKTKATTVDNGVMVGDKWVQDLQDAPRHRVIERASSSSTMDISYYHALGTTAVANFIAIARCDLLKGEQVNLRLRSGNTGFVTRQNITGIDSLAMLDKRAQDYALVFTETSAWRNWQLRFETAATSRFRCSKVFFGMALDAELEPVAWSTSYPIQKEIKSNAGNVWLSQCSDTYAEHTIAWKGVTNTKALEFDSYFRLKPYQQCFLHLTQDTRLLNGFSLAHCVCKSFEVRRVRHDVNEMKGVFTEL